MKKIPQFENHQEIILLWGKRADYAAAIGVALSTAQSHYARNSIGEEHLEKVVEAAAQIGHSEVTLPLLRSLKPRRRLKKNQRFSGMAAAA